MFLLHLNCQIFHTKARFAGSPTIGSRDASGSCLCQMKSVRPGVDDSPVLHTPAKDPASHLAAPESDCDPGNEASGAEDQITFAHPEPGCVGLTNNVSSAASWGSICPLEYL